MYTNSEGKLLRISEMETTHLTNALAKLHREIYNSVNEEEFKKASGTITLMETELLKRETEFFDKKWGGNSGRG